MTGYLKAHYDLDDPDVISILDEISIWSAPFARKMLEIVPLRRGMKVLDVGCGMGFPLIELAMRLGDSSVVYGIDPWEAGIARVRQKIKAYGLSNVQVIEGKAEELPFDDRFFDLIVSNNGLNNVHDLGKSLTECHRTLRPDGHLLFTFNTERTFIEFYDVYRQVLNDNGLEQYEKNLSEHIHSKRRPVPEIGRMLEAVGFTVKAMHQDVFHYRFVDGTATLNHFVMKLAFLEPWKNVLPPDVQEQCFSQIERRLNTLAAERGGLSLQVPFVCVTCQP